MTAPELNKEANAPRSKAFFPLLVLGSGIALSILLHFVIKDNVEGEAQLRFERQASDAKHVIEARIHSYADVMYGLRAMFSASSVSRTEFHRYVAGLELAHRYQGHQPRSARLSEILHHSSRRPPGVLRIDLSRTDGRKRICLRPRYID